MPLFDPTRPLPRLVSRSLANTLHPRRSDLGTSAQRITFDTLHTASRAAAGLRGGLTEAGAERAIKHLRTLLGAPAVALTDHSTTLAVDASGHHHAADARGHASAALASGRTVVLGARDIGCDDPDCATPAAVVAPLTDEQTVVGCLVAYAPETTAVLVRAVDEVAAWVSGQLELASAEQHRRVLAEAELRALRAQISPHFIYNCLTAIAASTRTDPDHARELLLEFADFTRYALRRGGDFTTLAEELRNTERYLVLEQARFGDRLRVSLRVAPEVLPTVVPFLVLQPLVENAVRHGLDADRDTVTVSITAADDGDHALLTVEDDGAGADPHAVAIALLGNDSTESVGSVGLANVDSRMRQLFGDDHGIVVETAPDLGTKVSVRIPKFAPGATDRGAS